jgi:hypothetical protein
MAIWRRLKLKSVTWMFLLAFCFLSLTSVWAQENEADFWPQAAGRGGGLPAAVGKTGRQ